MDNNTGNESPRRPFAHAAIEWTVENFCLAVREEDNCICSEEFLLEGDYDTKWKLMLRIGKVISNSVCISFVLARVPEIEPGPETLFFNCEIIVTAGKNKFPAVQKVFILEREEEKTMPFPTMENIIEFFPAFHTDKLKIEFNIIVFGDMPSDFVPDLPAGLAALSKDLKDMLQDPKFHQDVIVEAEGRKVKAHKFMLNRNRLFRSIISQNPPKEGNKLRLNRPSYKDLKRFIKFMYTGDMLPLLKHPSLSMYDFVKDSGCHSLLRYYAPDRLRMNTEIELIESSRFYWTITDFSSKTEGILSPLYRGLTPEITWRMRLNPLIPTREGDYISIYAEVLGWEKPKNVCLEFALVDALNHIHYRTRIVKADMNDESVGCPHFFERQRLESNSLLYDNDTIRILLRPRVPANRNTSTMCPLVTSFVTVPPRTWYEELSAEMATLLQDSQYYDLDVHVGGEIHHADRSVIAARSPKLRRALQNVKKWEPLFIRNMSPLIFKKFLFYIYCGVYKDCEFKDLLKLYRVANSYGVKGMQQEGAMEIKGKATRQNEPQIKKLQRRYNDNNLAIASQIS